MSLSQSSSRVRKRAANSTSKNRTTATPATTTTQKTGPYSRNFQQHLTDHGVYPDGYEHPDNRVPPLSGNLEEINQRLAQPRPSLSQSQFSDTKFRKFKRADAHAFKVKQVTDPVIPIIEGKVRDARCVAGGIPLANLDHLADGTLAPSNPDYFYGARPEQENRRIRKELSSLLHQGRWRRLLVDFKAPVEKANLGSEASLEL